MEENRQTNDNNNVSWNAGNDENNASSNTENSNNGTWNAGSNDNGSWNSGNNDNTSCNTENKVEGNGNTENIQDDNVSSKNRLTAMVLCILLGFLGVHRLYAGKIGTGFLMAYGTIVSILATCVNVPMGLMCLITMAAFVANDFAVLAFGQFLDVHGKYMSSNELH